MKVKLEIELELPDGCKEYSDDELIQIVFDNYTHYVTKRHYLDALTLSKHEDLSRMHSNWAEIASNACVKTIIFR